MTAYGMSCEGSEDRDGVKRACAETHSFSAPIGEVIAFSGSLLPPSKRDTSLTHPNRTTFPWVFRALVHTDYHANATLAGWAGCSRT